MPCTFKRIEIHLHPPPIVFIIESANFFISTFIILWIIFAYMKVSVKQFSQQTNTTFPRCGTIFRSIYSCLSPYNSFEYSNYTDFFSSFDIFPASISWMKITKISLFLTQISTFSWFKWVMYSIIVLVKCI